MIALILSMVLSFNIPIDYYYEEPKMVGISRPINRKERRKRR